MWSGVFPFKDPPAITGAGLPANLPVCVSDVDVPFQMVWNVLLQMAKPYGLA
jgi:hypothetical protein